MILQFDQFARSINLLRLLHTIPLPTYGRTTLPAVRLYVSAHSTLIIFSFFIIIVRAQKSLGLVNGSPDYAPVSAFLAPDVPARTHTYSADGRLYAYALPTT